MTSACVIVNYNDSERVIKLVNELYLFNLFKYIVVVDNNSLVNEIEKLNRIKDKAVLIYNKENHWFSGANNDGFCWLNDKHVDYVFTINSDVYVEKNVLQNLIDFIDKHEDISITSCQMIENNEKKQCYYDFPTISHSIVENLGIAKLFKLKPKHYFRRGDHIIVDYIRSSLWCIRFNALKEINGFDENTLLYHVETCVGLKMKERGYKSAILLDLEYYHNHIYKKGYKIKGYKDTYRSLLYIFKYYLHKSKLQIFIYKISFYIGLLIRKVLKIR